MDDLAWMLCPQCMSPIACVDTVDRQSCDMCGQAFQMEIEEPMTTITFAQGNASPPVTLSSHYLPQALPTSVLAGLPFSALTLYIGGMPHKDQLGISRVIALVPDRVRQLPGSGAHVTVVRGATDSVPIASRSVDLVVCTAQWSALTTIKRAVYFRQMHRILRNKGTAVVFGGNRHDVCRLAVRHGCTVAPIRNNRATDMVVVRKEFDPYA